MFYIVAQGSAFKSILKDLVGTLPNESTQNVVLQRVPHLMFLINEIFLHYSICLSLYW
jgi:hypothetical protein